MSRIMNGFSMHQFWLLFAALISLCVYPVLFVYFYNIKEAAFTQVFSPIIIFVLVGLVAWLVFWVLSATMSKGSFIAMIFMVVFINYSLIDDSIRVLIPGWRWWRIAPVVFFFFINLALTLRLFVVGTEADVNLSKIVMAIGTIYMALTIFNAFGGINSFVSISRGKEPLLEDGFFSAKERRSSQISDGKRSNFYFFIFDEYARQDILEKYTGYDNTPFLDGLKRKGFSVSNSSYSSSIFTQVSVGNLLHYNSLYRTKEETLGGIKKPPLLIAFKNAGYKIYTTTMSYQFDKDLVDTELESSTTLTGLSIKQTVFSKSFIAYLSPNSDENHRESRLALLKQVSDLVEVHTEEPKFLFFHIMLPHEPFVFDKDGDPVAYENMYNWADVKYYVGQLQFSSIKINQMIDSVLKNDPDAVLLIQSDHGPRFFGDINDFEKKACFNSLYLSGEKIEIEGLSAIDTLRLAMNYTLGLHLDPIGN